MSDRHAFRAEWHDYNSGIYFVTICSKDKQHIFGKIKDNIMILSDIGKIVERCILDISNYHINVELWNHVIMPNHIHMVINVGTQPAPVGTRYIASEQATPAPVGTRYIASEQATPAPVGTRYIASEQPMQTAGQNMGCLRAPRHGEPCEDFHHNCSLAVVVGTFKAAVTRLMRTRYGLMRTRCGLMRTRCIASLQQQQIQTVWQPRYHEHIIRNQRAFENIMNYVDTNIEKWSHDCFYTN